MKAAKEKGDVIDKIVDTVSRAHKNLNVLDFTKVKSISSLIKSPQVKYVFSFAPLDVPNEDLANIGCGFEDVFEVGTECCVGLCVKNLCQKICKCILRIQEKYWSRLKKYHGTLKYPHMQ